MTVIHIISNAYKDDLFLDVFLRHHASPSIRHHVIFTEHKEGEIAAWEDKFPDVEFIPWCPQTRGNECTLGAFVEYVERCLFDSGARVVGHLDADEMLIPSDPMQSLDDCLEGWIASSSPIFRPQGWRIHHDPRCEVPAFSRSDDLLFDRHNAYRSVYSYSKPFLVKQFTRWIPGFHETIDRVFPPINPSLDLVHLAHFDLDYLVNKNEEYKHDDMREKHWQRDHVGDLRTMLTKQLVECVWTTDNDHPEFVTMRREGPSPVKEHWRRKFVRHVA